MTDPTSVQRGAGSGTALVYGVGIAGEATARALIEHGYTVVLADDSPNDERRAIADRLGAELVEAPDHETIDRLVRSVDLVAPAPGVPETHAVVGAALAHGRPLRTEIDLAYVWESERVGGPRPMIAITGTDGKTTTTMMVAAMLESAGVRCAAVGNTELPLIDALSLDVDAFAVECSSFRLSWVEHFRAEAAIWLNLAPDHQNWHRSMASYEQAKANIWKHQRPGDVAIGWADDPVVMRHMAAAPGLKRSFGLDRNGQRADYHVAGDGDQRELVGPGGPFAAVGSLRRRFPHDITNALAASAACLESGLLSADQIDAGLAAFEVPHHRIEPIGDHRGISWFNDSKATSPHAALTAIRSFASIVLIAGGRNKGLDLQSLADESSRVHAVVAIGESAPQIEAAFAPTCRVVRADSMAEAVTAADAMAAPGDVVLLSPACASFDWYPTGGYPARGDDFRQQFELLRQGVAV